nr:MAG TPA_asm: hypothetical protein [Caudoviricetes sp.]
MVKCIIWTIKILWIVIKPATFSLIILVFIL